MPKFQNLTQDNLSIVYLSLDELTPWINNPRTHSKKQILQIAESIKTFGFTNPILLDDSNNIIAGHGRLEASRHLDIKSVPTIKLSHMTEAERRAYVIADNKLAENANWDRDLLSIEFEYLSELDLEFDLTITGFEIPEIDILLDEGKSVAIESEEVAIPAPPQNPVTKVGDLWILGDHKVLCADALQEQNYKTLLGDEIAGLVFTDPPYNVPIDGHVCGTGSVKHEDFVMASGEMTKSEFTIFLQKTFEHLIRFSSDGSIHYICMDWRHIEEIMKAGSQYTEFKNLCVWNKNNGGMGSLYRSKHELVFVFKNGKSPHINNINLGQHGRYRTNVWDYAGVNAFRADRMEDLAAHPTVKPTDLVADAILDCSKQKDIILDCFGGSGTTLIAAERTGRKARLIEMAPEYVDVTIERFEKETGKDAILVETGETYKEIKQKVAGHE